MLQFDPGCKIIALPSLHRPDILGSNISPACDTPLWKQYHHPIPLPGIVCELEVVPEATHTYSPNYDIALIQALSFLSLPA
jgi:hypothetical protein